MGAHELKLPPRYDIVNAAATADFNLGRVCMLVVDDGRNGRQSALGFKIGFSQILAAAQENNLRLGTQYT